MQPSPSRAPPRPWRYEPGSYLGRYQILRRLASGGMAELYLGCATGIEGFRKLVALKRVLPQRADDEEFTRMFLREARLAACLDHPNIAQVLDIGDERGEYFFVMEYVHGENVSALLRATAEAGPPLASALAIVLGVAAGLHYAHERAGPDGRPLEIVHRDVSPQNVLVSFEGSVKLVDFGIAKAAAQTTATRTGVLKGKIGYMSPEQCRGDPLDRRSDVFALGILLYELTCGRRMFFGDNDYAVMNRITSGTFTRPTALIADYPAALEQICLRAVDLDRDRRYPTAEALQSELEDFVRGAGLIVSPRVLAGTMRAVFGERPYPTLAELLPEGAAPRPERPLTPQPIAEPDEASRPTRVTGTVQPSLRRRNVLLLAGATGVAVLASILARTPGRAATEPEPAREAVPAAAPVDAPPATAGATNGLTTGATAGAANGSTTGATAGAAAGTTDGSTTGATAAPTTGTTTGSTAGAASTTSDAPATVRDTATRRRSKARAETPRPGASTTPAKPPRDLDAMFPGGR